MSIGNQKYTYIADVLDGPSAGIPALMGVRDMSALNIHVSVRDGSFVIPGPGGLNIGASPGTEIIQMRRAGEAKHWFLPVADHLKKTWAAAPEKQKIRLLKRIGSH